MSLLGGISRSSSGNRRGEGIVSHTLLCSQQKKNKSARIESTHAAVKDRAEEIVRKNWQSKAHPEEVGNVRETYGSYVR